MPKIKYIQKEPRAKRLSIIGKANSIISEYQSQGYGITIRQLYYQFVSRGFISNIPKEAKVLQNTINDGRLAGLIDWDAIEDRTRNIVRNVHWGSTEEFMETMIDCYTINTRETQDNYIEVWVEKEALSEVVEKACHKLDITSFACRGYTSLSEMWRAAQRMRNEKCRDKKVIILHLGDHDPSGIDMTRDIKDRLALFGVNVTVKRIALTMKQIKKYKPPPNPAKVTDKRYQGYIRRFGKMSWELDALEPSVLNSLIREAVNRYTDDKKLRKLQIKMEKDRKKLMNKCTVPDGMA